MNVKKNAKIVCQILFFILGLTILTRCSEDVKDVQNEYYSEEYGYEDGTYCAEVKYYNSNTETNKTYTLEVEVENNELTIIYWNNGGWLDEDHFSPESLDEKGYCTFTSDKGYEYEITIIDKDCGETDQSSFQNDVISDEESIICPRCGNEKDSYEEYCYSCDNDIEDEEENTCRKCGGYEYGVYGGLCSSCK